MSSYPQHVKNMEKLIKLGFMDKLDQLIPDTDFKDDQYETWNCDDLVDIARLCTSELEQAHKEIEALKATVERMGKCIWQSEFTNATLHGAEHEHARMWANEYVANIKVGK